MTNDKVHPCLKALDADCFRTRPAWAKQAFAYRLVHLLTPKALTKRLPKGLRRALLAPGVVMPPGVEMPPGVVVGPGGEIPAGWTPADPMPTGVTIPPGTVFPPGWSPGDPLPEGVTLDPGATFPPGWSPGDPLPPGAIAPGTTPPGVEDTGATPPAFVAPGEPGPVSGPGGHLAPPPGVGWGVYFDTSYWAAGNAYTSWESSGPYWMFDYQGKLITTGTWANGLRPTKFRMALSSPYQTTWYVTIKDTNEDIIFSTSSYETLDEIDLAFGDYDLYSIFIPGNMTIITNIELLV